MSQSFTIKDARTQSFNRSKLFEWLLDNDCPFEWETVDSMDAIDSVTLKFTEPLSLYPEPEGDPSY